MTGCSYNIDYIKKIVSGLLIVGGSFLLLEHLFNFGGFDIEIIGHEYYGFGMIIAGFLLSIKWKQLKDIKKIGDIVDEGDRKPEE